MLESFLMALSLAAGAAFLATVFFGSSSLDEPSESEEYFLITTFLVGMALMATVFFPGLTSEAFFAAATGTFLATTSSSE
jgi:hypothetical protein